jgi:hypothetical protein
MPKQEAHLAYDDLMSQATGYNFTGRVDQVHLMNKIHSYAGVILSKHLIQHMLQTRF